MPQMDHGSPGDVTELLRGTARGDKAAEAELISRVYGELRRLAGHYMRAENAGNTLQTTDLVHEAYLRLVRSRDIEWQSRAHFFAVAATNMRRILVDHARSRLSKKRDRAAANLREIVASTKMLLEEPNHVLALDDALTRLAELDLRQCQIVELRFFAGMSVVETAELLRVSPRTVKREWQLAKAWLLGELTQGSAS